MLVWFTHQPPLTVLTFFVQDNLCFGITSDKAVVKSQTETLLTCTPPLTQVTLVLSMVEVVAMCGHVLDDTYFTLKVVVLIVVVVISIL